MKNFYTVKTQPPLQPHKMALSPSRMAWVHGIVGRTKPSRRYLVPIGQHVAFISSLEVTITCTQRW